MNTNYFWPIVLHFCHENELTDKKIIPLEWPWPYCEPCWSQNTSGCQCCLHFFKFILLHPVVFFCIINKLKVWGNSNFKAYYLHVDFMEMVRVLSRSQISGTQPTFWRALTTSAQLRRRCQWSISMEIGANVSHHLCTNSQDLGQWRTLLMTLVVWHNRPDWMRLEPKI